MKMKAKRLHGREYFPTISSNLRGLAFLRIPESREMIKNGMCWTESGIPEWIKQWGSSGQTQSWRLRDSEVAFTPDMDGMSIWWRGSFPCCRTGTGSRQTWQNSQEDSVVDCLRVWTTATLKGCRLRASQMKVSRFGFEDRINQSFHLHTLEIGASHTYVVFIKPNHILCSMNIPVHFYAAGTAESSVPQLHLIVESSTTGTELCCRERPVKNDCFT